MKYYRISRRLWCILLAVSIMFSLLSSVMPRALAEETISKSTAAPSTMDALEENFLPDERKTNNANYPTRLDGTGNLIIAKEVEHDFGTEYAIPEGLTFTFSVALTGIGTANATFAAAHSNGQYTEITTDERGVFTVELTHGQRFEVFGLPGGTQAQVVERDYGPGFTPSYWDNGLPGDGRVNISADVTASVLVVNDYQPQMVSPVNIQLGGTLYVINADGTPVTSWNDGYVFTVVLQRHGQDGWQTVQTKVLTRDAQSYTFDMSGEIYDQAGVYSYQIYELEPKLGSPDRVEGMIYDIVWHTFSVYVGDADMDGSLEILRVHSEHADKDFQMVDGVYVVTTDFTNVQSVTVPALVTVDVQMRLDNPSGSTLVGLSGYGFGLYTDPGCTVPATDTLSGVMRIDSNPTDAVGEGWIDIVLDRVGSYTFYVKERPGSVTGMLYSQQVIKVVIEVTASDVVNGALVAQTAYYNLDGTPYSLNENGEAEFTNVYQVLETQLSIDFVTKVLKGRVLAPEEFTFAVQTSNKPILTLLRGTNDAEGNVIFDGTLQFTEVGVYYYYILETTPDGGGIISDKTVHRMRVTVSDLGGRLSASCSIVAGAANTITFVNAYAPIPATQVIRGKKVLDGRQLLENEFTFILEEVSYNGEAITDGACWQTRNQADGRFVFPQITYYMPGAYVYHVSEVIPEDGLANGITYDSIVYEVTVRVEDNGFGQLEARAVETVMFVNVYTAPGNPGTGDFDAMGLWLVALFVSSGGVITLCACGRKREEKGE